MTTLPALVATEATSPFDYSTLDNAIAAEARTMAERIRKRLNDTRATYIATGRDMLAIRDRLGHGQWGIWLNAEFDMTERTAQNFMNAAKLAKDKPEIISHLPITAVYKHAAPSTPHLVQEEIAHRIAKGERPSTDQIETRIAEVKDEQAKEAARARELNGKSEADIKAFEKRKKDREDRERREREKAELLNAEQQRAAQEAMELLQERLGCDLLRFAHLCICGGEELAPLGEMITNTVPIVSKAELGCIDEVPAEASHGFDEEGVNKVDHDPAEEVVAEAEPGYIGDAAAEYRHGFAEESVDKADHGFTEEIVPEAELGFTEEFIDDDPGIVEEVHAEIVVDEAHPNPAELTELDLGEAA